MLLGSKGAQPPPTPGHQLYQRHRELIVEYNVGLKTLLEQHEQGMSGLVFCGDLFCEFKGTVGCFSNSGFWGEDLTDGVAATRS